MKRIFIAVDIPDEARRIIAAYIEDLRRRFPNARVGWERPEKFHLTLKFIGQIDDKTLEELCRAVGEAVIRTNRFEAILGGTGLFPSTKNPRVLWIGLSGDDGEIASLAKVIDGVCEQFGIETEKRKFHPHLTIGRIKDPSGARELGEFHLNQNPIAEQLKVTDVVVYESKLSPAGSSYFRLAVYPLEVK
jgi:2'-5' RNA ligase